MQPYQGLACLISVFSLGIARVVFGRRSGGEEVQLRNIMGITSRADANNDSDNAPVDSVSGLPLGRRLRRGNYLAWVFSGMGLFSLLWFLVRVIPKPSRAAYPCQRVA